MNKISAENRMKAYLQKIAAGPKLSKNLTESEAEDALSLILDGKISQVRIEETFSAPNETDGACESHFSLGQGNADVQNPLNQQAESENQK